MPSSPTPRCFWHQWVLSPPLFDFVPFQTVFNSGIKAAEIRQQAPRLLSDNLQIKIRKAFVWWLDGGSQGGGATGGVDTINFMFVSLGTLQEHFTWFVDFQRFDSRLLMKQESTLMFFRCSFITTEPNNHHLLWQSITCFDLCVFRCSLWVHDAFTCQHGYPSE